jgi:hypothetical protein
MPSLWLSLSFLSKESNQRKVAAWSRPVKGSGASEPVPSERYTMPHFKLTFRLCACKVNEPFPNDLMTAQ